MRILSIIVMPNANWTAPGSKRSDSNGESESVMGWFRLCTSYHQFTDI